MPIKKENPNSISLIRVELDQGADTYIVYGSKGPLEEVNISDAITMTDIYADAFKTALDELTGLELPQRVEFY